MNYYYEKKNEQGLYLLQQYIYDVNFFRFNWHPEIELLILLRGSIIFCIEGESYKMYENDVILANANSGHAVISEDVNSLAMILHFSPEAFLPDYNYQNNIEIQCRSTEDTVNNPEFRKIRHLASQMMKAALSDSPGANLLLEGSYKTLMGTLLSEFPIVMAKEQESFSNNTKNYRTIKKIITYMEKNYAKRITLEHLAHIYKYNKSYLSTFFRTNVGISFYDYLTRIRFRHALQELSNTDKTLTDIAYDCGFSDLKAFSFYFKKQFHTSPSQQRASINVLKPKLGLLDSSQYLSVDSVDASEKLQSYLMEKTDSRYEILQNKNKELTTRLERLSVEINTFINKIEHIHD